MSKGFASNHRIVVLASLVFIGFSGLGFRLVQLHVLERAHFLSFVEKARREIIPQYARRGDILDISGGLLATSHSMIVLGVDPESERPDDAKKWPELSRLTGVPLADLQKILTTKYRTAPATTPGGAPKGLVLNFKINDNLPLVATKPAAKADSPSEGDDDTVLDPADSQGQRPIRWAKISEAITEQAYAEITKLNVAGVYGNRVYRRSYPHNELAAHLIGYVDKEQVPVSGMEHYADFYLRGQDGWLESEKDGHQHELAQFRSRQVTATDGYNVVLSIDSFVQTLVEGALNTIVDKYHPQKATIIVSDPRTGFILGMGSVPSFNLNDHKNITEDQQTNSAVSGLYEPGSVFKIVAISGAIEEGLVTPATRFDCNLKTIDYKGDHDKFPTTRKMPREDISDHFVHPLTVAEVIAHSSNQGTVQTAMLLGDDRFYHYVQAFGFGLPTGFPVGGEDGPHALRRNCKPPAMWDGATITHMPMGQGVAVTALQMEQAMSVLANGGVLLRPQIIKQVRDSSGEIVYRFDTDVEHRVVSEKTARTMASLLERVASKDGGGPEAEIPGYEVAGKTGTAQKPDPKTHGYMDHHHLVSSFVGFLPASRPQVVIAVIVDDADYTKVPGGTAYGHMVCAPIFHDLATNLISYLDIRRPYAETDRNLVALEGGRR